MEHSDPHLAPEGEPGRLARLEESHLFLERHVEQLAEAIADLGTRIEQMSRRFTTIESRLDALNTKESADEASSADQDPP